MAPDINSLPPSRSSSSSVSNPPRQSASEALHRQTPSSSPRSPSISANTNSNMQSPSVHYEARHPSMSSGRSRSGVPPQSSGPAPHHERRRSSALMHLNLTEPGLPGPGEMQSTEHRSSNDYRSSSFGSAFRTASPLGIGDSATIVTADPHHSRAPSLGEIHQEIEQEQEAQVNRLLQMIRQQQTQILQMQQAAGPVQSTAVDDSTPASERSVSFSSGINASGTNPRSRSPVPRTSAEASRRSSRHSRTSSRTSPALRPMASGQSEATDWSLGGRDEAAFFQAETQNLTRENQMLRHRIRELGESTKSSRPSTNNILLTLRVERQINDLNENSAITHSPVTMSNLASPPIAMASAQANDHPKPE
ncbi:hypothetical protein L228DRAFT_246206 [Xylona heveae TC161]|uniref:Uncharacterized protein n=1 Tax=Xylona heveae (strain CBS 132557 / TC161) TaxID=1328760 RepID=A0A165HFJ0_XYLHT|nr:hypothetical protein L228DRAFT_246206 [Xylona heveae TC161]KZF23435.1 hypothetical protein L228DRAFT_246206 [Xylona heveae TC161]